MKAIVAMPQQHVTLPRTVAKYLVEVPADAEVALTAPEGFEVCVSRQRGVVRAERGSDDESREDEDAAREAARGEG